MSSNEFHSILQKQNGSNIVHITTDTDQNLDELFRAVIGPKDCQIPLSKPMRQRNLPASFFTPPETGSKSASHSRESSIDNSKTFFISNKQHHATKNSLKQISNNQTQSQINTNGTQEILITNLQQPKNVLLNRAGTQILHSRAHSSPATLQQTLSVPLNNTAVTQTHVNHTQQHQSKTNTATIQHIRQMSDINQIPLPKGWEQAIDQTSGRTYFINHNDKTTTWNDPRLVVQQEQLKLMQLQQLEHQKHQAAVQRSVALQQQQQQQQQVQHLQQVQLQQVQLQQRIIQQQQQSQAQQQTQIQQPHQAIIIQNNSIILPQTTNVVTFNGNSKLPNGWEQRKTEDGEIYYINHNDCTTSWFDPRIPNQLQKPHLLTVNQINRPPPNINANDVTIMLNNSQNLIQNNVVTNHQQAIQMHQVQQQVNQHAQQTQHSPNDHHLRVQQLHLEREKMRQRQQEIQSQQRLFNPNISENTGSISPNNVVTTTGIDPFLGGTLVTSESHSRQESADSGLSIGSNYSLPHTPEVMLDSDLDEHTYVTNCATEDLGLDSLAITGMDLGENMESDDLLPSLPEIGCPDIHLSEIDAILAGNPNTRDNWIQESLLFQNT